MERGRPLPLCIGLPGDWGQADLETGQGWGLGDFGITKRRIKRCFCSGKLGLRKGFMWSGNENALIQVSID